MVSNRCRGGWRIRFELGGNLSRPGGANQQLKTLSPLVTVRVWSAGHSRPLMSHKKGISGCVACSRIVLLHMHVASSLRDLLSDYNIKAFQAPAVVLGTYLHLEDALPDLFFFVFFSRFQSRQFQFPCVAPAESTIKKAGSCRTHKIPRADPPLAGSHPTRLVRWTMKLRA